jgi:D-3-phosphoglycerate dehydrogenase / 2-oxoglutarate reductase
MNAFAPRKVYVYDPVDEPLDWLTQRGVAVTMGAPVYSAGEMRPKMAEDDLITAAGGHQALMGASGARVTRRVLESLPEVRYISKLGIGYEVIDMDAATQLGVMVTNTPVHSEVALVAEHAIALMLGLLKRLHVYARDWLQAGRWKDPAEMSGSLQGATVGIVGFGQIGQAVATRLTPWRANLLATDVRPLQRQGVTFVELDALLQQSDIVTLHAPGQARGAGPLIDRARLDSMRRGALLVNTARGNLIDMQALTERLRDGRLAGAALDVYDPEPPDPGSPLLGLRNVLLTPHVAAWHPQVRKEMAHMAFENLWSMLEGQVPEHLVNREVLQTAVTR